ncbi:MAG: nucleotidyl transferase AbiEii/AbiGii toxin family protein, partial [Myxococcales bacterium]|nr:nucleotidyl transferase AbiEii/AbiGii toxin family protein [Myxococcales bacterium]
MSPNVAASVRARLQNRAKKEGRPFQELLQYYGLERFLFRLAHSPHRDKFILKGALMLRVWEASSTRPTRDIDFLGFTDNDIEASNPSSWRFAAPTAMMMASSSIPRPLSASASRRTPTTKASASSSPDSS